MKRRLSIVLALVVLLVTSGCTLPGADLTADAEPVSVNEEALNATGYALEKRAPIAFNATVGIAGENRTIGMKSWISGYKHTDHKGRFVVFSTPSPPTEGTPMNPFANQSERRDIARMFGEVFNTTPLTVKNRYNTTMLGEQTEVVTYTTTNQTDTGTIPVVVHIAMTQHAGDAVVAVSVHPQSVNESQEFERFIEHLEHGESS